MFKLDICCLKTIKKLFIMLMSLVSFRDVRINKITTVLFAIKC